MTLIPLNRRNFVHNHVEVRPSIDYVSASNFFNNFEEVLLETSGTLGDVRAIGTYSPRVKEINPYYFSDHPNNTNIGLVHEQLNVNLNEILDTQSYLSASNNLDVLCKNTWKFGIDRVQQRYMPFDINLHKKLTLKNNVYRDYQYNKGNDNIENVSWSFSNYNCINFFTVGKGDISKTGFSDSVIHTNGIVYPNIDNQYEFTGDNYTISFWINPRYKQPEGQSKNNSCIINIPGLLNIYQIKGTETDINGLEKTFRIGLTLSSNTAANIDLSGLNLTNNTNQQDSNAIITKDCLKYNNWHNVVIKFNKANSILQAEIFVDKVNVYSFTQTSVTFSSITNSLICLGNKVTLTNLTTDLNSKVTSLFTKDGSDNSPSELKFISAGKDKLLPTATFTNITEIFSSNRTTSEALEAEIHDIRIYNNVVSETKIQNIYEKGLTSIKSEANLVFYVPVYFIPENIKKKTYVNASSIESERVAGTNFNFVTNPYYFNNCGGHQVASELFLLEWVKESRPNIVLGNRINNDFKDSIIEGLTLTNDPTNQSFRNSKLGQSYHEMYLSQSLTSGQASVQTGSYIYNNNLIMPCDNGLQIQYFDIIKENFSTGVVTSSYMFKSENNLYKYSQVNLENSFVQDENDPLFPLPVRNLNFDNEFSPDAILLNENQEDITLANGDLIRLPHRDVLFNVSNANYHESSASAVETSSIGNSRDRRELSSFDNIDLNYFNIKHFHSNPVIRDYSKARKDISGNSLDGVNIQKQFPLYKVTQDPVEYHSVIFNISSQLYNRKIRKETFSITDYDLFGTANTIKVKLKESGRGMLYRADALTKHAEWNYIGHIFYSEGFCTVLHPSLYNFGKTNFRAKFESENAIFVSEVNIPLAAGLHNKSHNKSYDPEIKVSESAYEKDQKFVYISEINLHDESLNIVARAKLAQPVVKRETDNMVFRLKMDY